MPKTKRRENVVLLLFALCGWIFCAAVMGISMALTGENNALIIHLLLGPLGFSVLSLTYFKRHAYAKPLFTAIVFTGFVILADFIIVATLILKSYDMFTNPVGTWIPFVLIFLVVLLTGNFVSKQRNSGT